MTYRLNATAGSLLGFLHRGPSSGWDLLATARVQIGQFWSITPSQVYRELAAMQAEGLIVAGESGPRDRRPYTLTDTGRQAFTEWIRSEPGPEVIRYPLLLTVAFGVHLEPDVLAGFLDRHRTEHAERLERYREVVAVAGGEMDPYARATLDFGIRYETAVLAWFDALPREVSARAPRD